MNTPLGYMTLTELRASHKRAYINQTTQFNIIDQEAFGRFSAHLITAENFTWNLRSENLNVRAIKFPMDHGISFNKDLTLPGSLRLVIIISIAILTVMGDFRDQ